VTARVSKHHLLAFQPTNIVISEACVVFTLYDYASFAILQSSTHEAWARHSGLASTMKTDIRYTPSTCFETFPFPKLTPPHQQRLNEQGEALHLTRSQLQTERGLGLTKLWNLVLDPACEEPDIQLLRELKESLDRAVLDAFGWSDVGPIEYKEIVRRLRVLNRQRAR
jgi:hypothetical protein